MTESGLPYNPLSTVLNASAAASALIPSNLSALSSNVTSTVAAALERKSPSDEYFRLVC